MPLAGTKALVLWHASQAAPVTTCAAPLPGADDPLWQVWQVPGWTCRWLNFAPENALVEWQASQACVVGKCCADITRLPLAKRPPLTWQLAQSRGVPLNTPPWWQASHRTVPWVPVNE